MIRKTAENRLKIYSFHIFDVFKNYCVIVVIKKITKFVKRLLRVTVGKQKHSGRQSELLGETVLSQKHALKFRIYDM